MRYYLWIMGKKGLTEHLEFYKKDIPDMVFNPSINPGNDIKTFGFIYLTLRFTSFIRELNEIVELIKLFGYSKIFVDNLSRIVNDINNPMLNLSKELLIQNITSLQNEFKSIENDLKDKISKLNDEQRARLDEAITNYHEECYFSCVAMSVSAIELELSKILPKDKNLQLAYDKEYGGKAPTFGTLIKFFYENIDAPILSNYKWLKDFKYLLEICNHYRIFSVHAKGKYITNRVAIAVLNLTFEFLLSKPIEQKITQS